MKIRQAEISAITEASAAPPTPDSGKPNFPKISR